MFYIYELRTSLGDRRLVFIHGDLLTYFNWLLFGHLELQS